jgi:CRP-like cAMP-binding protein
MNLSDKIAVLRSVGFLSTLDEVSLGEVAERSHVRHFPIGKRIVSELEFGTEIYVIAKGQAEVSVHALAGARHVLGVIGPGATFGEMASLTGELRSATVRAVSSVDALVISDRDFDRLRVLRPEVAVSLLRVLASRLSEAEQTLKSLLAGNGDIPAVVEPRTTRGAFSLLWRELVVNHEKDLAFLTLSAFVLTLILVRLAVYLSFTFDFAPRDVLRVAYVSGFGLVILSACTALLTFRPNWRRAVALAYGVGAALIINELGVTLAFDIFFKDINTPDPSLSFDVERLYRRTEPVRAMVVGLVVLLQSVYLKSFYARAWFIVRMRLRRALRRP